MYVIQSIVIVLQKNLVWCIVGGSLFSLRCAIHLPQVQKLHLK